MKPLRVKASIIPITDAHNDYALKLEKQIKAAGIRAVANLGSDRMNAKIRNAQLYKVPYMAVVGDAEMAAETIALRLRDGSRKNDLPVAQFIEDTQTRIKTRAKDL